LSEFDHNLKDIAATELGVVPRDTGTQI